MWGKYYIGILGTFHIRLMLEKQKCLLILKLFIFFRNIDVLFEIRFKKVEFGLY